MADMKVVFIILGTYFISSIHAQNEPQITKNILPEIKRYGTTGRLNCTVARQAEYKVHWRKTGDSFNTNIHISSDEKIVTDFNPIVDSGHRKYEIEKIDHGRDTSTYMLIVRRLMLRDAGTYVCLIQITGDSDTPNPSKDGDLIVLIPPSISQLETTQVINANMGEDVTLHCEASGYPKPNITWVRPNGMTFPTPYSNLFSVRTQDLALKNLSKTDGGVFRCIADNNVHPPDMYDATLYVNFIPSARAVQTTYGQAQNRMFDVTIECRIAGFPAPDLKWYKMRCPTPDPITDNDRHVIHVLLSHGQRLSLAEFWYQLTIINVQANDYGDYICEGTNSLGTSNATINLYETSECQGSWCLVQHGGEVTGDSDTPNLSKIPPTINQPETTHVAKAAIGENVTLQCEASGYPEPNITWVRPNGMTFPNPFNDLFSVEGSSISLDDLDVDSRGVYRCIADNNVPPLDVFDVQLYVDFPPIVTALYPKYWIEANRQFEITIKCLIEGSPSPELRWYKTTEGTDYAIYDDADHRIDILSFHHYAFFIDQQLFHLTIKNVQDNDYGNYTCEAVNIYGTANATIELYEEIEFIGEEFNGTTDEPEDWFVPWLLRNITDNGSTRTEAQGSLMMIYFSFLFILYIVNSVINVW